MARLPRFAVAGYPHHVIQRGNNRQPVFRDTEDHERYLGWLRDVAVERKLAVHAYVLMPNHVHLLVTPPDDEAIGRSLQSLGRRYVRWFNEKHRRTGTLWEGRFRSSLIDSDRYLLTCMRYIELNPVRAGLAADAMHFPWSSFAHHVGARIDPLITDHPLFWALGNTPFDRQSAYRRLFESPVDAADLTAIRYSANRGRILGQAEFLRTLEPADVGSFGPARPKGRPRKGQSGA